MKSVCQLFLLLTIGALLTNCTSSKQRPNIIIIFTDDQGYADLGCYGNRVHQTPRLDQLAKEGTRFTSFYAQHVCGPSRSALLTGRYPIRSKGWSMPAAEITWAELLQEAGYQTACFWKVRIWTSDGQKSPWSSPAKWTMGLLHPEDWTAKWISMIPESPEGSALTSRNNPMLRKSITLSKPVKEAQVSICGLGYYELYLNGSKVGDHVLDPTLTCYHKKALYVTYDITDSLKQGGNALGVQLAKSDEEKEYADLAEEIKTAFIQTFYDEKNGTYSNGSHTGMSTALYFGLVAPGNRKRVADNLAESLRNDGYTIRIGCLGSKFLLRALADNGHLDVAYKIITKVSSPGWGFLAASNLSTLSESLDGSGSDNHVFMGDISAWMMTYLAGIRHDPAQPGFQRFLIKPEIAGDLEWVSAHHDSPYGRIISEWKAEVTIPAHMSEAVTESGDPLTRAEGIKFLYMKNGKAVFEAGSGIYHFISKLKTQ